MAVWISTRPEIHESFLDSSKQECHITLAYLKAVNVEDVLKILKERTRPISFTAEINGFGTWIIPDGYVRYASVLSRERELQLWQAGIAAHFYNYLDQTYPFIPHITLDYGDSPYTTLPLLEEPVKFAVDNLYVSEDDTHYPVWTAGAAVPG